VEHARALLDEVGLGGDRLEMFHIGASDAPKWAQAVETMTRRAMELGPNPLCGGRPADEGAGLEELGT
jgi:coenzyme F420-reducing hydrogenase delta subunit